MTDRRLERFEEALDRHGPELEHWPQDERAAAATFLVTTPAARALHSEAKHLQGLLGQIVAGAPIRPGATQRILGAIAARRAAAPDPLMMLARPRAAAALTLVALVMFALGAVGGSDFSLPFTQASSNDGGYSLLASSDEILPTIFEGD